MVNDTTISCRVFSKSCYKMLEIHNLEFYMSKKKAKTDNHNLDNYIFINSQDYSIEKKPTALAFISSELAVYLLISLASYFSVYIGTNKFSSEQALTENMNLLTKYFSNENLENSLLGIFIVIGLVSSLNYVITNSKLSIDSFLNRLTHSFIDLIFLMLSSMLGLFLGVREYISVLTLTPSLEKMQNTINMGICLLLLTLLMYVGILFIIQMNKGNILNLTTIEDVDKKNL